jgi:hypothetical protein
VVDDQPASGRNLNLWSSIRDLAGPAVPAILDAGHTFDLIDEGTWPKRKRGGIG